MPFIGKQPQAGAYSKLDAITTSATATYNLTLDSGAYYPQSANHLLVSLNGVIQAPQDSFTVSGSQIIFDSALTSADVIDFIIALGDTLDIGVPSAGSVNTSQLANDAVTSAKIAAGAVDTTELASGAVTSAKLDTNIAVAGDLTVDTNTFHVDASSDSVGIGTTSLITASGRSSLTLSTANEKGELHLQNRNATTSSDAGVITYYNGSNRIGAIQGTADGATDKGKLIFMALDGGSAAGRMDLTEHGLTFNGDASAANALDDYEEGTWTPSFSASSPPTVSYNSQVGNYTKVGRMVMVNFYLVTGSVSGGSGDLKIAGLPFAVNGPAGSRTGNAQHWNSGINSNSSIGGYGNGTEIILAQNNNDRLQVSDLRTSNDSNQLWWSFSYITNA